MGNGSTSFLPAYNNCFSDDLSRDSFTPGYWDSHSINESFKISSIFTGVMLLLFLVVGLPSNLIVMYGIIRQHLYKEPTHMLLLNLAISDFLICLLVMPLTIIASFSGSYIFGDSDYVRCRVCQTGFIYTWLTLVSVYMLGLLSIDRFIYIKFALYYNKYVTTMRMLLVIIVLWVASLIISLLPIMGFGEIRYSHTFAACVVYFLNKPENFYYGEFIVSLGLPPFIVILVCNIWIGLIVRKHIKQIYRTKDSFHNRTEYHKSLKNRIKKAKNHKQLVLLRTFGAILVVNIALWSPLLIYIILLLAIDEDLIPLGYYIVVYIATVLHAVLHPIIEGFIIPEVRHTFKKVLISPFCQHVHCNRTSEPEGVENSMESCAPCCGDCFYVCSSAVLPEES